jgi:hypothetical protein
VQLNVKPSISTEDAAHAELVNMNQVTCCWFFFQHTHMMWLCQLCQCTLKSHWLAVQLEELQARLAESEAKDVAPDEPRAVSLSPAPLAL